jgi:hypothetical protein
VPNQRLVPVDLRDLLTNPVLLGIRTVGVDATRELVREIANADDFWEAMRALARDADQLSSSYLDEVRRTAAKGPV